ncbi:hypothetical protein [Herminiimonas arsenitoxidans]|uniref:hypothetical protein n=1 Tax=Herminiimonas arsenitoxidans TaxID=1809410 RepID=UPI0009707881|nr:hypothetical protein [Herminiimonas arsenitoxidans]
MSYSPSKKFTISGIINDDTLVLGIPHHRFKQILEESFSKQFEFQARALSEKVKGVHGMDSAPEEKP